MASSLRSILIGTKQSEYRPYVVLALALGGFVTTFAAYALGIFSVSGGIVWVPFYAAVVGMVAACWVGYRREGLVFGWVVTYSSLLGWHAEWALYEISRRPLIERIASFVQPDGLAFLAVEGMVLGTLAFTLGALVRWAVNSFRSDATPAPTSRE